MNLRSTIAALRMLLLHPAEFLRRFRGRVRRRPEFYRKRFRMRLDEWILYHHNRVLFAKPTYMGIPIQKNPMDAWIYQELLHEVRPEVLVEFGSGMGSSSLYFAHLFDVMKTESVVVTVDQQRMYFRAEHPRIVPVTGDSNSQEVYEQIAKLCEGKRVMVIHDADHTRKSVERDLELYSPLVTVGSYFVIEDGISDLFTPGDGLGVTEEWGYYAAQNFLAKNPNWMADLDCERYIFTYNPHGFLKRLG